MSKKVLIISSSPRRHGNSDVLCDEFLRGATEAGHEVEKLFLGDYQIEYCTGCGACNNSTKPCPQRDDAAAIIAKMIETDVIVMASPVYFFTICAQMKALIDRSCARYLEISNKEFWYIVTAAEQSIPMMERTVECFRGFTDCLENPHEMGVIYGVGAWKVGEIQSTPAIKEAYEAGRRV